MTLKALVTRSDLEKCERWFVRRGLPHFIDNYSYKEDIFTRCVPFLSLVVVAELFFAFEFFFVAEHRGRGWVQALVLVGGIVLLAGALITLNLLRGRRALQLPDTVHTWELVVYFGLPLLFVIIGNPENLVTDLVFTFLVNLLLLGLAVVVTRWGVLAMFNWTVGHIWLQLAQVGRLFVRALPILLVFSAFIFLNAEMWQIASDFTLPYFGLVALLLLGLGTLFMRSSVGSFAVDMERMSSWKEVRDHSVGTPMEGKVPDDDAAPPDTPPLGKWAQKNVRLLLFVSQSTQVLLVSLTVTAFYIVFGLLAVREETVLLWTSVSELQQESDWLVRIPLFGNDLTFTRELVLVSLFIGMVSGLHFTVLVVLDDRYRAQFLEEKTEEMRQAMAVRAVYYRVISTGQIASGGTGP